MSEPDDSPTRARRWFARISGVPLIITVVLHAVVLGGAGVWVVKETMVAKKKSFEPTARETVRTEQRQIEHRIKTARQGGAVSAQPAVLQRITSASSSTFALPSMPLDPSAQSSPAAGWMSSGASGIGLGRGTGMGTSLGGLGSVGRGFTQLDFLGITTARAQKVVFVVDVSRDLMDIRKGGFEAFAVIRDEMIRLVNGLPGSAQFGVVLFGGAANDINLFEPQLVAAKVANKEAFRQWMEVVNADPDRLGTRSAGSYRAWTEKPLLSAGIDEQLLVPNWVRALRAGLQLAPDTVFLVTGSGSTAQKRRSGEEKLRLESKNELRKERLRRQGIDPEGVARARNQALAAARAELASINADLKAKGQSPFIVSNTRRLFDPDFQAELKRRGYSIVLDTTGWADAEGRPIWELGVGANERVEFAEVLRHISQLQQALLREKASVNIFLFVGPDEKPKAAMENLAGVAGRNQGKFELLTSARLKDLVKRPQSRG